MYHWRKGWVKNSPNKKQSSRNVHNENSSLGNRITDIGYSKDKSGLVKNPNLQSNNSFGPETYFSSELVQKNKLNGQYLTEGAPSINESHTKDYYQSRNYKTGQSKSYNKGFVQNSHKSPVKITKKHGGQKLHPSYS